MNFLLPYKFKKIGSLLAPSGIAVWVCMQLGFITPTPSHHVNVLLFIVSFFSFLGGLYFIAFSREKVEDPNVKDTLHKT